MLQVPRQVGERIVRPLLPLANTSPEQITTTLGLQANGGGEVVAGFVQLTQDARVWPQAWDLFQAFGKADAKLYTAVGAMLERIGSGEHLLGYNIFASYALARSKKDPGIGWVLPNDYTLLTSRVCPLRTRSSWPLTASHSRTVSSTEALARRLPSGLKATL